MGPAYSKKEIQVLRENYPVGGAEAVHALLPHRSLGSIQVRAWKLKLKSGVDCGKPWDASEDAVVQKAYQDHGGIADAEKRLSDRTRNAISSRARRLNVKTEGEGAHWTEVEDATLMRTFALGGDLAAVHVALPSRSLEAIATRGRRLGVIKPEVCRRWSKEENEILTQYIRSGSDVLPELLFRSPDAVKAQVKRLKRKLIYDDPKKQGAK